MKDELFTALANQDRRSIIRQLQATDGVHIHDFEGIDAVSVRHQHLPVLVDAGIVVVLEDTVVGGEQYDTAIQALEAVEGELETTTA